MIMVNVFYQGLNNFMSLKIRQTRGSWWVYLGLYGHCIVENTTRMNYLGQIVIN